MEKIITKDNSVTFRSKTYDECYHTKSGAIEEAFEKYAKPCKLKDGMKILDICFGIGYNTLAAIQTANVEVVGLENDKEILKKIEEVEVPEELKQSYEKIKQASKTLNYQDKIKIIVGDARKTIKSITEKFDAVFLDPFSPKKCPELWTAEFMKEIAKRMKKGAILATYSCARVVRENLKSAGFKVEDGPCIGRRSPSTLAYLK
jgi:tRNA U34 5-methylaminomethyl-2-thiouridine-forming methyltransferase MnmC